MQPFMMNKMFHYATKPGVKQKSMTWYKMLMSNKMTMPRDDPRSFRPIMGEYTNNRHFDENYGVALPYGNNNSIMPAMKWKMMQMFQNNNVFDGMNSKGAAQQRWMNMYKGMSNGERAKGNISQDMIMYDKKSFSMKNKHLNKMLSPKQKRWANKSMGMGKGRWKYHQRNMFVETKHSTITLKSGDGQMSKGKGTTNEQEK